MCGGWDLLASCLLTLCHSAIQSKFVRRHMEAGARHAVQEYYKAKTKLQDCKMQIRKVLYEMEEPILSRPSSSNRR